MEMTKRLSAAVIKNSFVWREGYSGGHDTESNTQRFILSSLIERCSDKTRHWPRFTWSLLRTAHRPNWSKLWDVKSWNMEANPRQNVTKSSPENKIYYMFLKSWDQRTCKYWLHSLPELLIHKDAILDFEVGVGEASNGTRHFQEFLITLYTRHLINQEGNSCNKHPNGCNFHCRIGAIVDLNTKKKQNRSNTCWFQLPKFEDFLLFCFSLSFMKANEESFGFWMFWCTKEAIWRACWLNRADKS